MNGEDGDSEATSTTDDIEQMTDDDSYTTTMEGDIIDICKTVHHLVLWGCQQEIVAAELQQQFPANMNLLWLLNVWIGDTGASGHCSGHPGGGVNVQEGNTTTTGMLGEQGTGAHMQVHIYVKRAHQLLGNNNETVACKMAVYLGGQSNTENRSRARIVCWKKPSRRMCQRMDKFTWITQCSSCPME